ncbi:MAG: hypothetical protein KDD62_04435, partial [Bdellovibrionales bacterium]|nr:hypothetical protein [Bdellovibrionales bacterium]
MPALSLGDFKKGNIFFTLIVVIAVCVLLFIPDLIGINTESILDRSTVSTSNTFEEMVPEQEQQDEIIPAAVPALPNEEAP